MRQTITLRSLTLPALLLLAALPAACKSTEGHDRAADTADQVVAVGHYAGQTQLKLDKTLDALGQVEATKGENPTPAYKAFSSEFRSFSEEYADLVKERAALAAKSEAWFSEFEKQNAAIQDKDLREAGATRLGGFREQVGETAQQVDELLAAAGAVEQRLTDLRAYLGNDLTADGIQAASGKIKDVTKDGRKIAVKLGELSKTSETLASKMRAARKPAEPAK